MVKAGHPPSRMQRYFVDPSKLPTPLGVGEIAQVLLLSNDSLSD
jgi:hypothetical protein